MTLPPNAHMRRDAFFEAVARGRALMGILNVTPDSFSDGGKFDSPAAALAHARALAAAGADIIDVGAESTRPGHTPLSAAEEIARLKGLLPGLVENVDAPFSIDTYKAQTAQFALGLGVAIVNDVWGLQHDPDMAHVVAQAGAGLVIMHNRETRDESIDIAEDMKRFFEKSLAIARAAGVPERFIVLDPGVGFGKTRAQNWRALAATNELANAFGLPILIGVSRKSMFGALLGADMDARLVGTLAANIDAARRGARIFRVHDVAEHKAAFAVLDAIDHA
ncbi:MAG: dihydropteroate synthase [Hyphomicrobiales bacterium]|nr:dihydropteroate synthase [Hyphomicrobiales bacterium]